MSVLEFDSSGVLVCHTCEELHPNAVMAFLHLPTVDGMQTALANANVFVSETTAIRWRKEKTRVLIAKAANVRTDVDSHDASTIGCASVAKRMWKQVFVLR